MRLLPAIVLTMLVSVAPANAQFFRPVQGGYVHPSAPQYCGIAACREAVSPPTKARPKVRYHTTRKQVPR
jgi:hypothetical protein